MLYFVTVMGLLVAAGYSFYMSMRCDTSCDESCDQSCDKDFDK